jgi:hypothetical protein
MPLPSYTLLEMHCVIVSAENKWPQDSMSPARCLTDLPSRILVISATPCQISSISAPVSRTSAQGIHHL